MTSKVDKAQALIMRQQGRSLREIGDRYGVTRERVRQIVGKTELGSAQCRECDEWFCKKTSQHRFCTRRCGRKYEYRNRGRRIDSCPVCGGLKLVESRTCRDCVQRRAIERDRTIVTLWAAGKTISEIAKVVGITAGSLGVHIVRMRRKGYDLPYRRDVFPGDSPVFPEQRR